jgi:cell division protein ZapE
MHASAPAPILDIYLGSVDSGELMPDPYQREVVESLQSIADELLSTPRPATDARQGKQRIRRLFGIGRHATPQPIEPVRGLYVWGGVGRGKTHLVDLFFENLPIEEKLRLHFHRFMVLVHSELRKHPNVQDPLAIVAEEFARQTRLLCLDEIHVHDITDAMLLGELFRHLFERGVTLITTSNVAPDGLYHNGLQRQRFLPAIALLERHTRVLHVGGDMDYRTRALEQAGTYHLGTGELTDEKLCKEFHALTGVERHQGARHLVVNNRELPVVMWDDGIAWFTFHQLCEQPRSTDDYIQLAEYFHTIMVSDVPVMGALQDDAARRFVNMIDEFYDRSVNLVVSAAAEPAGLYTGKRLAFEFERTASRLQEMQSHEYIAREHLKDE